MPVSGWKQLLQGAPWNDERRIVAWDVSPLRSAGEVQVGGHCCFGLAAGDGSIWAGIAGGIVRIEPSG